MAAKKQQNPLGEVHYNELRRVAGNIKSTIEFAQKCDKCGLDVSQEVEASKAQLAVATGLLHEFFPDQPQ